MLNVFSQYKCILYLLMNVRWYCRYFLRYRNLEEMMLERGLKVGHSTINRWVFNYAPELDRRCRPHLKTTNDYMRRRANAQIVSARFDGQLFGKKILMRRLLGVNLHTQNVSMSRCCLTVRFNRATPENVTWKEYSVPKAKQRSSGVRCGQALRCGELCALHADKPFVPLCDCFKKPPMSSTTSQLSLRLASQPLRAPL